LPIAPVTYLALNFVLENDTLRVGYPAAHLVDRSEGMVNFSGARTPLDFTASFCLNNKDQRVEIVKFTEDVEPKQQPPRPIASVSLTRFDHQIEFKEFTSPQSVTVNYALSAPVQLAVDVTLSPNPVPLLFEEDQRFSQSCATHSRGSSLRNESRRCVSDTGMRSSQYGLV